MRQLIIIYEFQQHNNHMLRQFKAMIRKYGQFAFLTNNSCVIWTKDTAVSVREYLISGIGSGDKLYVGETAGPAAWTSSLGEEVSDYIIKNLK